MSSKKRQTLESFFPKLSIDSIDDVSTFQWIVRLHKEENQIKSITEMNDVLSKLSSEELELQKKRDWQKCAEIAEKVNDMKININPIRDRINMVKKELNYSQLAVCHYTLTRDGKK